MFAKVDVNGDDAHPLFEWLKSEKGGLLGGKIKWNFTKFLVGRDGQVIKRYGSTTKPEDIAKRHRGGPRQQSPTARRDPGEVMPRGRPRGIPRRARG